MGSAVSLLGQQDSTLSIVCKLVVDDEGQFAGLAPVEFIGAAEGRAQAFEFGQALVALVGKGFNPDHHIFKNRWSKWK